VSLIEQVTRVGRKAISMALSLLPGPPSDDAPPPDVDGRRQADADLTQITIDAKRKAGKGGYR
jgi:hypothetical protein